MAWQIEFYKDEKGREFVKEFINGLPEKHLSKALRSIDILAEFGTALREPYAKHIDDRVWELRIKFSNDISRIMYFTHTQKQIILLHGFIKKTDKTPRKEIETAKNRLIDYLTRRLDNEL